MHKKCLPQTLKVRDVLEDWRENNKVDLKETGYKDAEQYIAQYRQYITYGNYGKNHNLRPSARPRCRYEYNIKMELKEIESECIDWIHLAQDNDQEQAHVNTNGSLGSIKCSKLQFSQLFCVKLDSPRSIINICIPHYHFKSQNICSNKN
jgi:hypothetical protein